MLTEKEYVKKARDHQGVLAEAEKIRVEYAGEEMPEAKGKEFKEKCQEAEALQIELDDYERDQKMAELKARGKAHSDRLNERLPGVIPMPGGGGASYDEPAGYLSLGQAFVESDEYQAYVKAGAPKGSAVTFNRKATFHGRDSFIPVGHKEARERAEKLETKAAPTFSSHGASTYALIAQQRLTEAIKTYEFERLVLRDLVTKGTATSNAIQFPRLTSAKPTAATTVSDALTSSNTKPESTLALDVANVPVRTLAVTMPIFEQQLEDFPQIRMIVDEFLRFDIMRLEEYQMMWGDGTGTDLLGIMETPTVAEFTRTPDMGAGTAVTLLDEIRGAITDVQVNSLEPNGVVIHPIDFETLVLQKGDDEHYLRQIWPTEDGTYRVFSLKVVPTLAAESYRDGLGTHQRVCLVGDFRGGAILWDRHMVSVELGYIDKQFVQNAITIRAEERVGFAAWRPFAFSYIETVAGAS